jgi:hypothetical protein
MRAIRSPSFGLAIIVLPTALALTQTRERRSIAASLMERARNTLASQSVVTAVPQLVANHRAGEQR